MVMAVADRRMSVAEVVAAAAPELVRVTNWGQSSFVNMPLIYPSGSPVTVKLDPVEGGVRVSDNGFAFREVESIGAERSFPRAAQAAAAAEELSVNRRVIFVDVPPDQAFRAICDVAAASWRVTDQIYSRAAEREQVELEERLRERLVAIFDDRVERKHVIQGASSIEWDVSAIVKVPDGVAVFHAVAKHPLAVNSASAGFLDLSSLDNPPHLVAVVESKADFGPRLSLLSAAGGRVIEQDQPDAVYLRAAA